MKTYTENNIKVTANMPVTEKDKKDNIKLENEQTVKKQVTLLYE